MKYYSLLAAFFISLSSFSQIEFETGYFITNSGERVNCLIRNMDWNNTPSSFSYKTGVDTEPKIIKAQEIQEITVGAYYFKKFNVQMDVSDNEIENISTKRSPDFELRTVLLRYLIEGEVSLLGYKENNLERYYVKREGKEITPLIYKRYMVGGKLADNNRFRQQLSNNYVCDNKSWKVDYNSIDYKQKDLIEFFTEYNDCVGNDYKVWLEMKPSGSFSLTPKLSYGLASMEVKNGLVAGGNQLEGSDLGIGVEIEYNFNVNKNKWSMFIEPVYRSFSDEIFVSAAYSADLKVDYNSLSMFTGIRHYFIINDDSKFFGNLGVDLNFPINSKIEFANTGRNMDPILEEFDFAPGIGAGIGYKLKNKLNLEVRYTTGKLNGDKFVDGNYDLEWRSNYSSVKFILGYTIL